MNDCVMTVHLFFPLPVVNKLGKDMHAETTGLMLRNHWESTHPRDFPETLTNEEPLEQIKQISLDVSSPFSTPSRDIKLGGEAGKF